MSNYDYDPVTHRNLSKDGPVRLTFTPQDVSPKLLVSREGMVAFANSLSVLPMVRNATVHTNEAGVCTVSCTVACDAERAVLEEGMKRASFSIRTMGDQREVIAVRLPPLSLDYRWTPAEDPTPRHGAVDGDVSQRDLSPSYHCYDALQGTREETYNKIDEHGNPYLVTRRGGV